MKKNLKIKLLIIIFILFIGISFSASLKFEEDNIYIKNGCPTGLGIMLDTKNDAVIGSEILFGYDKNKINIYGIVDGKIFDLPTASRDFENMYYFATTNLGKKYFRGNKKIGEIVVSLNDGFEEAEIEIINISGASNDSNIVNNEIKDVLGKTNKIKLVSDLDKKCEKNIDDFDIFKEIDISGLTSKQAVEKMEKYINDAQPKMKKEKSKIYFVYVGLIILLIILFVFIIVYRRKKK